MRPRKREREREIVTNIELRLEFKIFDNFLLLENLNIKFFRRLLLSKGLCKNFMQNMQSITSSTCYYGNMAPPSPTPVSFGKQRLNFHFVH